jgi:hypothetical protein
MRRWELPEESGNCHRRMDAAGEGEINMLEPSNGYLFRATEAFLKNSHKFNGDLLGARGTIEPFMVRFYPVLQHYRPDIVGSCLALSFDDPPMGRSSQVHGFGLYMQAGDHLQDRDSQLGSYRDDGSYLALQAYDYFMGQQLRERSK